MDYENSVYLGMLISSLGAGPIFHKIKEPNRKKWFSTIFGFGMCAFVCGLHLMHSLILIVFIWLIIKCSTDRYVHVLGFGIGISYLVFFRATEYFNIPYPTGHANLIHMILTLKVVGLTFEVHDNYETESKLKLDEEVTEMEQFQYFPKPNFMNICHYGFCYPGIATGPYITYHTFRDMLKYTTKHYDLCVRKALEEIRWVPFHGILFLTASYFFPLENLTSDRFFIESTIFYRLWYMYPTFFIFRMRMYIAFKLSEAACILSGAGMYPSETQPKIGIGPTKNFDLIKSIEEITDISFETVHSMRITEAEFCSTVREATRNWNRSVQYWLANYVYRRCPSKKYRTLVTFFISSLWHGVHAGYYFSLFSVPFYLCIEDYFMKMVIKKDESVWKSILMWNFKMLQFSYWGLAFLIKDAGDILRYGWSVFFFPYLVAIMMFSFAFVYSKIKI